MPTEWPLGISSSWKRRQSKKQLAALASLKHASFVEPTMRELVGYIANGVTPDDEEGRRRYGSSEVAPPRESWDSTYLMSALGMMGYINLLKWEAGGANGELTSEAAKQSFQFGRLAAFIDLHTHAQYPRRFGGRVIKMLHCDSIAFMAQGCVFDCGKSARDLARLLGVAWNKQEFIFQDELAVAHFMLSIVCDWLDEPKLTPVRATRGSGALEELFDVWRTASAEELAPLVVAACDIHTHRCQQAKAPDQKYEFDNGRWTQAPIEILLLFRLREKLGLSNPAVDHPLMNTALGKLPERQSCQPNDLLNRVLDRMMRDGFDEEKVFDICYRRAS